MSNPIFMTTHTLDVLKNSITNPYHLDRVAQLSSNVTASMVPAGRVAYLNTSEQFELGLPQTTRLGHVAMFLWDNSNDYDVSASNPDPTSVAGNWYGTSPRGGIKAFVATGGFELESSEFVTDTYNVGDTLTSAQDNTGVTGGLLAKGVAYDVPICAVVSRKPYTNCHRTSVLAFYTVWLPRYKA